MLIDRPIETGSIHPANEICLWLYFSMSSFRIKGVNPDWKGSKVRKKGWFQFIVDSSGFLFIRLYPSDRNLRLLFPGFYPLIFNLYPLTLSLLRKVKWNKDATKTPGHQVAQSFKYQSCNLSGALWLCVFVAEKDFSERTQSLPFTL